MLCGVAWCAGVVVTRMWRAMVAISSDDGRHTLRAHSTRRKITAPTNAARLRRTPIMNGMVAAIMLADVVAYFVSLSGVRRRSRQTLPWWRTDGVGDLRAPLLHSLRVPRFSRNCCLQGTVSALPIPDVGVARIGGAWRRARRLRFMLPLRCGLARWRA